MRFFGAAKAQPKQTGEGAVKNGVVNIRETIELLDKRQQMLQGRVDKEIQIARQNAQKNKAVAIQALKRKKLIEAQLNNVESMRFNLESQLTQIESASMSRQVLDAMSSGAQALKQLHGGLDSDKIEETMDAIQDEFSVAEDLAAAISRPFSTGATAYMDEDDLLKELDELESMDLESNLMDEGPALNLPSAPTHLPVAPQPAAKAKVPARRTAADEEADDFAALQREMMA